MLHRTAGSVLCAVLLCALLPGAARAEERAPAGESLLEALAVVDLKGRRWDRAALDGQVVPVDFWATWCAPCLAQLPKLRSAYERYHDAGFEIVAVSLDQSSRSRLLSWLRRHPMPWAVVHEERGFDGVNLDFEPMPRRLRDEYVAFVRELRAELDAVDERLGLSVDVP